MDGLMMMKKFGDRLREAEKQLSRLEKRAKTLAEKQAVSDTERESLQQQITAAQEAISGAQEDRESLLGEKLDPSQLRGRHRSAERGSGQEGRA